MTLRNRDSFKITDTAEEIRIKTANILLRAKPPKSNITQQEIRAIKQLKNNSEVVILPADKGNATVILNTTDYIQKVTDLLDPETYNVLKKRPH